MPARGRGDAVKAMILCGGLGLRIRGTFNDVPKSLVVVRGRPLLGYILDGFVASGVSESLLLVGRDEGRFREFAAGYAHGRVTVVQTGADTPTGGRIRMAESFLADDDAAFVTYGDGVSDLDARHLLAYHRGSGRPATLTAVRPQLPFGLLDIDDAGAVTSFREKPIMPQYTNGGFFVFERKVIQSIALEDDLEADVLPVLATRGMLSAYRYDGFWKNMDTYKDYLQLEGAEILDSIALPGRA